MCPFGSKHDCHKVRLGKFTLNTWKMKQWHAPPNLKKKQQSDWSSRPFICISPHQCRLEEKLHSSIFKFAHCSEKHFLNSMWCYIHYGNLYSNAVILQHAISLKPLNLHLLRNSCHERTQELKVVHKQKIGFLKSSWWAEREDAEHSSSKCGQALNRMETSNSSTSNFTQIPPRIHLGCS